MSSLRKLFVIFAVSLLLAEIFLRIVPVTDLTATGFFWMPDAKIGWRHIPGIKGSYVRREFKTYCEFNSEGWRDYERNYDSKQNDTFRIIALGDSFTEAVQVPLEKTFVKLLEKKLNTGEGHKFEVVNTGCSGYGTMQEYLVLKEYGKRYKPDMVIAFFIANDVCENAPVLAKLWQREHVLVQLDEDLGALAKRKAVEWDVSLSALENPMKLTEGIYGVGASRIKVEILNHTYLPLFCYRILNKISSRSKSVDRIPKGIPIPWCNYTAGEYPEVWKTAWKNTGSLLLKVKEETQELGVRLLIVYLPLREEVYADWWDEVLKTYPDMKLSSWNLEKPSEVLAEFCRENDIKMLSLLPQFRNNYEKQGNRYHYRYDGHFNEAGHELTSELLYEHLKMNLE